MDILAFEAWAYLKSVFADGPTVACLFLAFTVVLTLRKRVKNEVKSYINELKNLDEQELQGLKNIAQMQGEIAADIKVLRERQHHHLGTTDQTSTRKAAIAAAYRTEGVQNDLADIKKDLDENLTHVLDVKNMVICDQSALLDHVKRYNAHESLQEDLFSFVRDGIADAISNLHVKFDQFANENRSLGVVVTDMFNRMQRDNKRLRAWQGKMVKRFQQTQVKTEPDRLTTQALRYAAELHEKMANVWSTGIYTKFTTNVEIDGFEVWLGLDPDGVSVEVVPQKCSPDEMCEDDVEPYITEEEAEAYNTEAYLQDFKDRMEKELAFLDAVRSSDKDIKWKVNYAGQDEKTVPLESPYKEVVEQNLLHPALMEDTELDILEPIQTYTELDIPADIFQEAEPLDDDEVMIEVACSSCGRKMSGVTQGIIDAYFGADRYTCIKCEAKKMEDSRPYDVTSRVEELDSLPDPEATVKLIDSDKAWPSPNVVEEAIENMKANFAKDSNLQIAENMRKMLEGYKGRIVRNIGDSIVKHARNRENEALQSLKENLANGDCSFNEALEEFRRILREGE